MERFIEILLATAIIFFFCLVGLIFYYSGIAKQEMIFEKTGKEISFIKALGYPNEYFISAEVKEVK